MSGNFLHRRFKNICLTPDECDQGILPTSCSRCGWNVEREVDSFALEMLQQGRDITSDGLHICEVCGDRYTLGHICPDCARQQWIDRRG